MSDIKQEPTATYITVAEFEEAQKATDSRLTQMQAAIDRIEAHLHTRPDQEALERRLEETRRNSLGEMQKLIEDRLGHEQEKRRAEIASVRADVNQKLDEITGKMDSVSGSLQSLTGKLDNWSSVIESRENSFQEREKRIQEDTREIRAQLEELEEKQDRDHERLHKLAFAVFGDRDGDRLSLYQLIQEIKKDMTQRFDEQDEKLSPALATISTHSDELAELRQYIAAEKQKWQRRRDKVLGALLKVLENRQLMLMVFAIVVLIIVAIEPDLRDTALYFFEQVFSFAGS